MTAVGNITQLSQSTGGETCCPYCGAWYFGNHVCAVMRPGPITWQPSPLTAEEVRKIIREELVAFHKRPVQAGADHD